MLDSQNDNIRSKLKPHTVVLGFLLLAVIVIVAFLYGRYIRLQNSLIEQGRAKAVAELDLVRPMPGSFLVRRGGVSKGQHGTVTDHYRSQSSYEQLREYYVQEFKRLGWDPVGERKVLVWGDDVGAFEFAFCKGGEQADLFFVGNQPTPDNITYTIGTGWGTGCRRRS